MKTHLALFLCVSLLLSGCVTANMALIGPKRKSEAESLLRIIGVIGDGLITTAVTIAVINANTGAKPAANAPWTWHNLDKKDRGALAMGPLGPNFPWGFCLTWGIVGASIAVPDYLLSLLIPRREEVAPKQDEADSEP